jgi:hypothetical protein
VAPGRAVVMYDPAMTARPGDPSETGALARLWYDGWQDAHAAILPPADAEAQLSARCVETAWLACATGNARAARFYEKCGWCLTRTMVSSLDTVDGPSISKSGAMRSGCCAANAPGAKRDPWVGLHR